MNSECILACSWYIYETYVTGIYASLLYDTRLYYDMQYAVSTYLASDW